MAQPNLTLGQLLKTIPEGAFVTLERIPHGGALQVRKLKGGEAKFYWRYTQYGKGDRVAIGFFDPAAPPKSLQPTANGFSRAAAIQHSFRFSD